MRTKKKADGRTPLINPQITLEAMFGKPTIIATVPAGSSPFEHLLTEGEEDMAVTDPCVMTDLE